MQITNLTHPGMSPVNGDQVKIRHDNGAIEVKTFFFSEPDPPSLDSVKNTQIWAIERSYLAAIQKSVEYTTTAGLNKTFQADSDSQTILMQALTGYQLAGATPEGFFWLAEDNTQVPFVLDDLKGLAMVMLSQGFEAFAKKVKLKQDIRDAATIEEIQAITW